MPTAKCVIVDEPVAAVAADAVEADDAEFAGYLRNRGRDLLSNDYESGDAAWVTGRFGRLNAQIGTYETYDDALDNQIVWYQLGCKAAGWASGTISLSLSIATGSITGR